MNGGGTGMDAYRAAGELAEITSLVDAFYSNMDTFPEARVIRKMHPDDLTESRKKLTYFLCGVFGGPRLFIEHYGGINLPDFHRHSQLELMSETHGCSACNMPLRLNPMRHHLPG
jgi:hemoglobin